METAGGRGDGVDELWRWVCEVRKETGEGGPELRYFYEKAGNYLQQKKDVQTGIRDVCGWLVEDVFGGGSVDCPVEYMPFVLRSVREVMRWEFGVGLGDNGVRFCDTTTGTGAFVCELLEGNYLTEK